MSFEKDILAKVSNVLGTTDGTSFCYGTLFIKTNDSDARKVLNRLIKDLGDGTVQMTKTPAEFAYDFI